MTFGSRSEYTYAAQELDFALRQSGKQHRHFLEANLFLGEPAHQIPASLHAADRLGKILVSVCSPSANVGQSALAV